MRIQECLVDIDKHPDVVGLREWLDAKVKKERTNWGIKGKGYRVKYDLELRWYPIFIFECRWLAHDFLDRYAKIPPKDS